MEKIRESYAVKSEQLMTSQRMREEMDDCVGQLRHEVTSLREMLNQERHTAESRVSVKEDALLRFEVQLSLRWKDTWSNQAIVGAREVNQWEGWNVRLTQEKVSKLFQMFDRRGNAIFDQSYLGVPAKNTMGDTINCWSRHYELKLMNP